MSESILRPNIRIEIQNNLAETMEVDEGEEGEITDANDTFEDTVVVEQQQIVRQNQRVWPNANGGFTTGINIFDKQEQGKLVERAKRFALNPEEIRNFTDAQLQELHDSLGITTEVEKDIRFEAIHMRGTDEMSTEDVLEYFTNYGPACVEWVNDESCNVVWDDKVSAARALFFLSKPIKGMPVEGPCDPFIKELISKPLDDEENGTGRSILLKDREIELRDDSPEDNSISVSDITVPIPPGYWRLGKQFSNSSCLLVRFALKSDKKPIRAEKFSDYYKKYGNPNYGGMKGLITESHKRKFKGIFDRNEEIPPETDSRNPWGNLAKNWNHDTQFREKEAPPISVTSTNNKSDIMSRIGFKRALDQDEPEPPKPQKRVKIPRMRMYADEEEERIKRKRELMKIKKKVIEPEEEDNKPAMEDLRAVLKSQNKKPVIVVEKVSEIRDDEPDLGLKLKNRTKNLRPEVSRKFLNEEPRRRNVEKPRRREEEDVRREESSLRRRRESPDRFSRRMRSDDFDRRRRSDDYHQEDEFDSHKPRSKVAVVIKTQKKPTVASTVWSRINADRERLKTVSEGKLRRRSSSSDSESSDSSSSGSSSSSKSESEDSLPVAVKTEKPDTGLKTRPGFHTGLISRLKVAEHRSPLRIEINNDHFKKE